VVRTYLVIDLKSFYASVECVERHLDPMTANLVVADPERSDKTICLAVSPAMKALGVRNRCRVFEIPKNIEYIMAEPRMKKYIEYSARIYGIYLRYISPQDIHVYSIDEAFLDVTSYLTLYKKTAREMAVFLMDRVLNEVGIRATCGIGTNMYLAKIALDITAKNSPDFIGVLDEETYKHTLWNHRPLTDFWRIGQGTAARLFKLGICTMGQLAHANEDRLYKSFGIDAELLIDHAWGEEPTTISDIKMYKPKSTSLSSGQVLSCDYSFEKGLIVIKEMVQRLCLDMTEKHLATCSVSIYVAYASRFNTPSVNGTVSWENPTNADIVIVPKVEQLYRKLVDKTLEVRRFNVSCNNTVSSGSLVQLSLFASLEQTQEQKSGEKIQNSVVQIQNRYGKNILLKGMNYCDGATMIQRNQQIGGHKSGS